MNIYSHREVFQLILLGLTKVIHKLLETIIKFKKFNKIFIDHNQWKAMTTTSTVGISLENHNHVGDYEGQHS